MPNERAGPLPSAHPAVRQGEGLPNERAGPFPSAYPAIRRTKGHRVTAADWSPDWLQSSVRQLTEPAVWRGVETQYASSSLQLVDSHAEHDVLELLLEGSKPPLPPAAKGKHFLLFTPFRYTPAHDSRFRAGGHLGIWYGARELEGACAEVGYWRMRFILDSAGLVQRKITTHHTFFQARVAGSCIDLMAPPWDAFAHAWKDSTDYAQTHRVANAAEAAGVQVIQYESVRAPGCACFAVFTPAALSEPRGGLDRSRQTWTCTATHDRVLMAQDGGPGRFEWDC